METAAAVCHGGRFFILRDGKRHGVCFFIHGHGWGILRDGGRVCLPNFRHTRPDGNKRGHVCGCFFILNVCGCFLGILRDGGHTISGRGCFFILNGWGCFFIHGNGGHTISHGGRFFILRNGNDGGRVCFFILNGWGILNGGKLFAAISTAGHGGAFRFWGCFI